MMREDLRGSLDDEFESASTGFDRAHVAIRAQCSIERRRKFLRGKLGLFLVVVDVVSCNDLVFGCLSRLSRTQDDAHELVVEFAADCAHQGKPGLLGFHHHIEQDDCGIRVITQPLFGLDARIGADQLHRAIGKAEIAEDEPGHLMNLGLIVHNEDLPRGKLTRRFPRKLQAVVYQPHLAPLAVRVSLLQTNAKGPGICNLACRAARSVDLA